MMYWRQNGAARHHTPRRQLCFFTATFLAVSSILLFTYLQWQYAKPGVPQQMPAESPSHLNLAEPDNDLQFLLRPDVHVSRGPSVRKYAWNVTKARIAPDGVEKDVFLINNQFPGPTIEARSGDILEVDILNLSGEEISFHWHGLHMRGANHMDGPVGLNQCAIKSGSQFTYQIPIDDQSGTFWYHAHSEVQRGDGLYGGLVIHNPEIPESRTYRYDHELLFLVGDWYHWPSSKVLSTFMSRTSTGDEPCPDSLLINGRGYFECFRATHGAPVNCSEVGKPQLSLDKRSRYRIRLVNVGSMTGISFTIPDSEMEFVQVDGGQPVISYPANAVGVLYPGERVDFVTSWPESAVDTDSEMIIELDKEYFIRPNFALSPTQSFLIASGNTAKRPQQASQEVTKFDLRRVSGVSLGRPLPDAQQKFMIYTSIEILNRLQSIPKGFINRTTWEPQSLPLISLTRDKWDGHQLVPWTGSQPVWVELTINNIDATGHPFHLHGHDFYVVGSHAGNGGWDYYNPFNSKAPRGGPFNLQNPVHKDTVYVPAWGYVVIRFLADNEGIWALHCHILWHHGSGMVMSLQVLGDEHQGLSASEMGRHASVDTQSCVWVNLYASRYEYWRKAFRETLTVRMTSRK